jgi:hypothetical protein
MTDLAACFQGLGFENVRTYIYVSESQVNYLGGIDHLDRFQLDGRHA